MDPRKCYVGATSNIYTRFKAHLTGSVNQTHRHPKFYNFCNKYGLDKKNFQVLELVIDHSNLLIREQYWLDLIFTYYKTDCLNILIKADSTLGRPMSIETRKLLSNIALGRVRSLESRKAQSITISRIGNNSSKSVVFYRKEDFIIFKIYISMSRAQIDNPIHLGGNGRSTRNCAKINSIINNRTILMDPVNGAFLIAKKPITIKLKLGNKYVV